MRRAVAAAEKKFKASLANEIADFPGTDGNRDAVVNLVQAVRETDAKVHVDFAEKIPEISLVGLSSRCFPETDPTDQLAAMIEKVRALLGRACTFLTCI